MIEIKWAREISNAAGNTIMRGRFCHEDCALYENQEMICRGEYGIFDDSFTLVPGCDCPGPGKYVLTKVGD